MIVLDENKINNKLCGLQTLWVRLQIYEWRCIGFASFYKVLHTYRFGIGYSILRTLAVPG